MTKARDVARVIAKRGSEQGSVLLITELFERQASLERQQVELAQHLSLMADLLDKTTTGTVAIRQQLEAMQRAVRTEDNDDLPGTAH